MLRCGLVQVALVLGITAILAAEASAPPPEAARALALAQQVQAHHATVKDMSASFVQTYTSGMLGREVVEQGTVAIKRPDRMRWKYEKPEEKLFVSDGRKSYFFVPADRQVIVRESQGNQGIALHLLSGRSDILTEFEVYAVPDRPRALRLVPRKNREEVQELVLEVDDRGAIRALEIVDLQGNHSSFRFTALQENVGLKDELFQFKIPSGVEVVTG
jgi:outer membrane lipoprotein carrier protein